MPSTELPCSWINFFKCIDEYRAEPKFISTKWLKLQSPELQGLRKQTRPSCCVSGVCEVHLEACWANGKENRMISREPRHGANNSNNSTSQFCSVCRFTESPHIPYLVHLPAQQSPVDIQAWIRCAPCTQPLLFFRECQSDGVEASGLFTCNTCAVGSQKANRANLGSIRKPAVQGALVDDGPGSQNQYWTFFFKTLCWCDCCHCGGQTVKAKYLHFLIVPTKLLHALILL